MFDIGNSAAFVFNIDNKPATFGGGRQGNQADLGAVAVDNRIRDGFGDGDFDFFQFAEGEIKLGRE